jgi:hypothetical protein
MPTPHHRKVVSEAGFCGQIAVEQMSDQNNEAEVRAVLDPVWFNTYWVENALGLYEGVSKHADELQAYSTFFGMVQKFSLDSAVMGICKLYDTSAPQYQKDTVPALLSYIKGHITTTYLPRLSVATLTALGISQPMAAQFVADLKRDFDSTKRAFFDVVGNETPNQDSDDALKRLFTDRNKVGAHQQRLDED